MKFFVSLILLFVFERERERERERDSFEQKTQYTVGPHTQ